MKHKFEYPNMSYSHRLMREDKVTFPRVGIKGGVQLESCLVTLEDTCYLIQESGTNLSLFNTPPPAQVSTNLHLWLVVPEETQSILTRGHLVVSVVFLNEFCDWRCNTAHPLFIRHSCMCVQLYLCVFFCETNCTDFFSPSRDVIEAVKVSKFVKNWNNQELPG